MVKDGSFGDFECMMFRLRPIVGTNRLHYTTSLPAQPSDINIVNGRMYTSGVTCFDIADFPRAVSLLATQVAF